MPRNVARLPARSLLDNAERKVFYCPWCFQARQVQIKTILKFCVVSSSNHRHIEDQAEVDRHYLALYLEMLSAYYGAICWNQNENAGIRRITPNIREWCNENMETQIFSDEDRERFARIVFKDAVFSCPNCGNEMRSIAQDVNFCMETGGCAGIDDLWPPGCYLCACWQDEAYRKDAIQWCARCFAENGGEVDCEHCLWELGKLKLNISLKEIQNFAENPCLDEDPGDPPG